MARGVHFTPRLFKFLRELKRNNRRDFIERYAQACRACGPLVHFVTDAVRVKF